MNPADQERKKQRERELKKNRKQREVVRQAIIKSKEPRDIIGEMELLDDMEYDPLHAPTIPARVIQEKRKKLMETLEKIREVVLKDNPESGGEFNQMLHNYESRRLQRQRYCGTSISYYSFQTSFFIIVRGSS